MKKLSREIEYIYDENKLLSLMAWSNSMAPEFWREAIKQSRDVW